MTKSMTANAIAPKAAIYARYSSDLQSAASIPDQIRLCEARAKDDAAGIVDYFTDSEISGDSILLRPGVQQMMQHAADGGFNVLYAEALDRISRDQEDIAAIYKRLTFAGVKIVTLAEGEINELHIGLKGTMNALFLKDLAQKTHRGLRGRAEQGKIPSGLCYGYNVVRRFDANGEPIRGEREINEEQARIIRRIFGEYVNGLSPHTIAAKLNDEGVPSPSGKGWSPSTLNGDWKKRMGLLNNELYAGCLVWNKVRYIKNPDTGKHVKRLNPEEEWVRTEVPELRIVDAQTWDKVKARQAESRAKVRHFGEARRPTHLLSHLLKCGCCGGGMSKRGYSHYGCTNAYHKGKSFCTQRRTIRQDDLEETILQAIRDQLMDPQLVEIFCKEYTAHLNRARMNRTSERAGLEAELAKLKRAEKRMVQAICDGFASAQMKDEMNANTARQAEIEATLSRTPEDKVLLHPAMADEYRKQVNRLVSGLASEQTRAQAVETIRSLIDKVVLRQRPDEDGLVIDLHGDLAGILRMAAGPTAKTTESETEIKNLRLFMDQNTTPRNETMGGGTPLCPTNKVRRSSVVP